jgi:hypothetical protein
MIRILRRTPRTAAVFALLLPLALGCGGGGSPSAPTDKDNPSKDNPTKDNPSKDNPTKDKDNPAKDKTPPGPSLGNADYKSTSKEFGDEYKKDKDHNAVNAKYKGKVIELTGQVVSVGFNAGGEPYLGLENVQGEFVPVMCFTRDPRPWVKAAPGQTVKLKGQWPEFHITAALWNCEIEEVTGPAPPALTADEFAQEYAKDPAAANKKYDGKWLLLTGEFDKLESKPLATAFKTKEKEPRVLVYFPADAAKTLMGLQPGQKIKVLGQYGFNGGKDTVSLNLGILMDASK